MDSKFIKGCYTIGRYHNICHQSRPTPRSQTCVVMKRLLHHMCVMSNEGLSSPIVLFKYDLLLQLRVSLSERCCLDGTSITSFDLLPFVLLPRVSRYSPIQSSTQFSISHRISPRGLLLHLIVVLSLVFEVSYNDLGPECCYLIKFRLCPDSHNYATPSYSAVY